MAPHFAQVTRACQTLLSNQPTPPAFLQLRLLQDVSDATHICGHASWPARRPSCDH